MSVNTMTMYVQLIPETNNKTEEKHKWLKGRHISFYKCTLFSLIL